MKTEVKAKFESNGIKVLLLKHASSHSSNGIVTYSVTLESFDDTETIVQYITDYQLAISTFLSVARTELLN